MISFFFVDDFKIINHYMGLMKQKLEWVGFLKIIQYKENLKLFLENFVFLLFKNFFIFKKIHSIFIRK